MRRRLIRWGALLAALMLTIWIVITGIAAVNFYQVANNSFEQLVQQPSAALVHQSLIDVSASAQRLFTLLTPLVPALRLAGGDGCAAANLVMIGNSLAGYGLQFADFASAVYDAASNVNENAVDIRAVRAHWSPQAAQSVRNSIADLMKLPECPTASDRFRRYAEAAQGLLSVMRLGMTLPWEAVLSDSSRWLIVLNNSDEIRATGGFMTAVITVWVDQGVLHWSFGNSYAVDDLDKIYYHPNPPPPMQRFMALHRWMFRDVNWSPDYPTTAALALRIYGLDQQTAANGMITVNMSALPVVLGELPPFTVNDRPVNADNSLDLIRSAWNEGSTSYNSDAPQRKQFIMETMNELLTAIVRQVHPLDLAAAGNAVNTLLARRDVLLYAADPQTEALFSANHWDGAMAQSDGDYLMVVDSDLGYNKVTPNMVSSVDYRVQLGAEPSAQVRLRYENTNSESVPCSMVYRNWKRVSEPTDPPTVYGDRMVGCFWNYVRVFAPDGARLTEFSGQDIPGDWFPFSPTPNKAHVDAWHEAAYDGFGTMTVTPTGQTSEVRFRYALPDTVEGTEGDMQRYQLLVQRQPGSGHEALTVTVELPVGAQFLESDPPPTRVNGSELSFESNLDSDRLFTIRYRP